MSNPAEIDYISRIKNKDMISRSEKNSSKEKYYRVYYSTVYNKINF